MDARGLGLAGSGARLGHAGTLDGVRPVPLSMPAYARSTSTSRELVTPSRPFTPTLYYVTDAGLALLVLAWLGCVGALMFTQRDRLRALRDNVRALIEALSTISTTPAAPSGPSLELASDAK